MLNFSCTVCILYHISELPILEPLGLGDTFARSFFIPASPEERFAIPFAFGWPSHEGKRPSELHREILATSAKTAGSAVTDQRHFPGNESQRFF